ncbi:flagellin [Insolitispirillum peregrinum]|uniref:Flagellin n=2 Tax=Insolitispirillum peregrinum TaxID=80876 RepID=A0A1N7QE82_9PROT|nr:flagellin [Insolitispirillum peregrinum]SIT21069.1 flagellin [Insolitispirillum peregrinum]
MPVISTNTAANSALRFLNANSSEQSSSLSKIASGSRINKASDDAAGLAISTGLSSDVTTLNQAATNASQASSILQIADGGMSNIADILERMKALATQSNSGSVTDDQRTYLQAEFSELQEEIDGIAKGTRYNGESLLDGTGSMASGVDFMVGTSTTDVISVTIDNVDTTELGVDASTINVGTQSDAQAALTAIDAAIDTVSSSRAEIGASMSRFEFRADTIATSIENTEAANSAITDTDVATEQTKLSSAEVKTQAAIAALSSANEMPQNLLDLLR